ncbi:MAG: hypothetical protein ACO23K_06585, partial [Ilumatobacteraceae bacterium]
MRPRILRVPHSENYKSAPCGQGLRSICANKRIISLIISRKGFGLMAQKAIVGEKVGMTQVWGDDQRV